MILRSGKRIRLTEQVVKVKGGVDPNFRCGGINLGSYCGLTEADIEIPRLLFDELKDGLREAHVNVSADGGGDTHFSGYLSIESALLDPSGDGLKMKAFTRTRWLDRIYVGQFTDQWEVRYYVVDPRTKIPTGWNPALILQHLFSQLPPEDLQTIGLGDIRCLSDIADITTPDITFRLTSYRDAINMVMGLVGDVAFRERFQGDKVLLDFYRVSEAVSTQAVVECSQWKSMENGRANIQALGKTDDGTDVTNRVRGYGGYRQYMITCRSYHETLPAISELEELRRLQPDWNADLEDLVLRCPDLATGDGETYSAQVTTAAVAGDTLLKCKVELEEIPVGASIKVKSSGEILEVTAFTPAVEADPEAEPPVEAQDATVVVTRARKGTTPAAIKATDTLDITVPGIQYVFRRYRLPAILNGYSIMRQGCLLDAQSEPYPQIQAFVYGAIKVNREDEPEEGETEGEKWTQGVIPGLLAASHVDNVQVDVERRRVTFSRPVVTLKESRPKSGDAGEKDVIYQRTVCGVTLTIENRDVPFGYDTGVVDGVVGLEFAENTGLSTHWQSNTYQFWCLGTAGHPIRGVEFPCLRFPIATIKDESGVITQSEGNAVWMEPGYGTVVRDDLPALKAQCEQILRERCRRARSWQITIPWFDPGYRVGQGVSIRGVKNVARDNYKITSVQYSLPADGRHATRLVIDNVKPPVRNRVRPT